MDEIKDIVNTVVGKISSKRAADQKDIVSVWENILKKKERTHAKISGLKDGQLMVDIDSSAWLFQFNIKKKKLLEEIQKEIPEVQKIYFRIGKTQ